MTEEQLKKELAQELEKHSDVTIEKIKNVLKSLPSNTNRVNIEIFPSQDRDAFFNVRVNLEGPDLHVLKKEIDEIADLFDPKYTENGIEPYIPTIDPFDIDYEANDIAVDCAANWLKKMWLMVNTQDIIIPVYIVGHDGYGTVTPIKLA